MKKYIMSGISALITLACINMMTAQASSFQDIVCHQQNPGVKICPSCKGSGEVGKCIKCSRCGGKGIVKA